MAPVDNENQPRVRPVRESIREVDSDSWIIGDKLLLSRQHSPSSASSWSDGNGSFYSLCEAPSPLPPSRPLPAETHIEMVYDAGDASAAWFVGDAVCKVSLFDPKATREHVTLKYLQDKRPLSFVIPKVIYHGEHDGRYYIVLSKLSGKTLTEAWPNLDEIARQHCVSQVVKICKELATWVGDTISGVDGEQLSDRFLGSRPGLPVDCSPQTLRGNSEAVGMDCSAYLFYHCDLGPGNIIVRDLGDPLGIIDWETAGFVPKEWIRTKFCVSSGLDLPGDDQDSRVDWRRRVQRELGKEGFVEMAEEWMAWGTR